MCSTSAALRDTRWLHVEAVSAPNSCPRLRLQGGQRPIDRRYRQRPRHDCVGHPGGDLRLLNRAPEYQRSGVILYRTLLEETCTRWSRAETRWASFGMWPGTRRWSRSIESLLHSASEQAIPMSSPRAAREAPPRPDLRSGLSVARRPVTPADCPVAAHGRRLKPGRALPGTPRRRERQVARSSARRHASTARSTKGAGLV
jgi:hypothetical protein